MNNTNFVELTEISNELVSREQVERLARRYYWASTLIAKMDVLEVACGTGQGLGLLSKKARSVTAGDYSAEILDFARHHYGSRFHLLQFDAQSLPFAGRTFDAVIIFEALYYVPEANRFFCECQRILRPGGVLLISIANKDLYDFNPSPHSYVYHGVVELGNELKNHGFQCSFYGDTPLAEVSALQRVLRPLKAVASKFGLIPKSMTGKKLLKRLIFGKMVHMPPEIDEKTALHVPPTLLAPNKKDTQHKVIYCCARLAG